MPTRIAACCMFVSGTAALVYEILWTRDLSYVFGGSALSLACVVAAFLTGLALGAWVAGRRTRPDPRMLRAYAWLEVGIAVAAPLVPWLVVALDKVLLDPLWPAIEARPGLARVATAGLAFVVMLPATACMGATLPVLCAAFAGSRERGSSDRGSATGVLIARLYGWNTLGGAFGCLFAGFVLVEQVGLWRSRFVAAGLNLALALWAWRLARALPAGASARPAAGAAPAEAPARREGVAAPLWALALVVSSGVSIVLELCWSRLVALGVGGTTYAFSIVLAVYLLGLGGGALLHGAAARRGWPAARLVAGSQIALALLILTLRFAVEPLLVDVGSRLHEASVAAGGSPLAARAGLGLLFAAAIAFVPSLLLGVAFPALADMRVRRVEEIGSGVGASYVWSTLGGGAASFLTTFALLPLHGLEATLAFAALASGLLGALLLGARGGAGWTARIVALVAAAATVGLFARSRDHGRWDPEAIYGGIALYGPRVLQSDRQLLSAEDGPSCSVAVFDQHGDRSLSVNGKVDASTRGDMGTQLLLAWLPQLLAEEPPEGRPSRVFVLGWGAGVTASAAARFGAQVRCAEIEPAVVKFADLFESANGRAHERPDVQIVVDDGRAQLRRSRERWDVITTEPSNPWLAGMASLFTVEFYELCRERLAEGGVLCQWVQLYWSAPADYHAIFATLGSVFPHVAIWRTTSGDTLMLGSRRPLRLDPAVLGRRASGRPWLAPEIARSKVPLSPIGAVGADASLVAQLARMVLLEGGEARAFADAGPRRVTDDVPFLEFSAARRMQADSAGAILAELHEWRRTPLYAQEELAAALAPAELAPLLRDVAAEELKLGATALAEPLLLEARRREPSLAGLNFWLWLAARRRGAAADEAARLATLEKETPALLAQVAEEHARDADFDVAWRTLDRMEKRLGLTAEGEWQRGRVRELEGRRVDAAACYERALRLDADYQPASDALKRMRASPPR
jgi:spermidine synthase